MESITRRAALRRLACLGLVAPAMSGLVAACGGGSTSGGGNTAPAAGGTTQPATQAGKTRAVIGIVQEPTSLDPTADATASIATCLRDNVYEGLVRLDQSGKIVPGRK